MAEDQNTQVVEPQSPEIVEEQASTPTQETEKMVSVAEMQRRLKSLEEKHSKDTADAISKALEKYKAESELTGKELEEYRRKEAEAEKQALLDKIAGLEKEQTKRELTDEAIKTLYKLFQTLKALSARSRLNIRNRNPLKFHPNLTGPKAQIKGKFLEVPESLNNLKGEF